VEQPEHNADGVDRCAHSHAACRGRGAGVDCKRERVP